MALLSTLKVLAKHGLLSRAQFVSARASHDHKIRIQPSQQSWNLFKDHLHFYVLLGLIPTSLITAYAYIFIGEAELTEIPEGYTPQRWEYYKSPISRFISKYGRNDDVTGYESFVAKMAEESEKMILKKVERDIYAMMHDRADNKSYFYARVDPASDRYEYNFINNESEFRYVGIRDRGEPTD